MLFGIIITIIAQQKRVAESYAGCQNVTGSTVVNISLPGKSLVFLFDTVLIIFFLDLSWTEHRPKDQSPSPSSESSYCQRPSRSPSEHRARSVVNKNVFNEEGRDAQRILTLF